MFIVGLGALFFGLTVGWISYRILRRAAGVPGLSDLIVMVGIIAGAAVLGLFRNDVLFAWYSIGLVVGFFGYFVLGLRLYGQQEVQPWLMAPTPPTYTPDPQSHMHGE